MKKTFKYETHMHTREASGCASASGAQMVRAHINAGYSGMVVTDHFFNGNSAVPRGLSWETQVELFCKGYDNAVEQAKGTGFHVFFGWEYTYFGTDFLTYGLDRDFLLDNPDMLSWSIEEYFDRVHEHGGFLIHAHPFREASYIDTIRLFPEYVDAVEVINKGHIDPEFDRKALEYAKEHSLIQTAGTDSHHIDSLYGAGMEFSYEIKSIEDLIQAIKGNDYSLLKGERI